MRISSASRFAVFFFSAILVVTLPARLMADEPPLPDGAAILSKAAGLVDLQAPGGAPFFLLANVSLREGNKTVDGVFAMTWAAPGQYHRVFRFPGFESSEVVTDGVIWRKRSTEALPLMIWELDQLVSLPANYRPGARLKLHRVQTEGAGEAQTVCVLAQQEYLVSRICVNGATGAPSSIDRGSDISRAPSLHEHFEFSDYQPFEGRTFPRKLTFRGWGSREIEVQVQKLIRAPSFPADEFAPPKGSSRTGFCESPETSGDVHGNTGSTIPIGFTDLEIDMFFQVSPAGGVQHAQVVYSSDPLKNNEILHWFLGTHFPIKTCAGTPIGYEMLLRLATGH